MSMYFEDAMAALNGSEPMNLGAPLDLSEEKNRETLVKVTEAMADYSSLVSARFAEAYDRKGYASFDSFSEEFRNPSYNGGDTVVLQLTYVLNDYMDQEAFNTVKAEGDALKERVTKELKEKRRAELEAQLSEAKAKAAALQMELHSL